MRIKNTGELVLRANSHARHDRVRQGTYGRAHVDGKAEFEGCWIGCLTTPHRKPELRDYLRRIFGGASPVGMHAIDGRRYGVFAGSNPAVDEPVDDDDQVARLGREFGICPELARSVEALFEAQMTHGAAIEFLPAAARAMPEGADVRPDAVRKFWRGRIEDYEVEPVVVQGERGPVRDAGVEATTAAFLGWLRSRAPRRAAAA